MSPSNSRTAVASRSPVKSELLIKTAAFSSDIARAFLANPSILLLDEPTSSVEPDSEATIIAALDRLMAGRTMVLTSHRPSLINQADMVYVIAGGKVTEAGSPQELAAGNGWFSRFIKSAEALEPTDAQT